MRWTALGVAVFLVSAVLAGGAEPGVRAAILGGSGDAAVLQGLFRSAGYEVDVLADSALSGLSAADAALVVLPPGEVFPAAQRRFLGAYLASGGCFVDLSPGGLSYEREAVDPLPVPGIGGDAMPEVILGQGGSVSSVVLPDGVTRGLALQAPFVGFELHAVRLSLDACRSAERTLICFSARGDVGIDALRLVLRDSSGHSFVAFVELSPAWRSYALPMADFMPSATGAPPPAVDPAAVESLAFELHYKAVWKEARGGFSLGPVSLAQASRFAGVARGSVARWLNHYQRSGAQAPEWIVDPFCGATRLAGPVQLRAPGLHEGGQDTHMMAPQGAWSVSVPPPFRGPRDLELRDALVMSARFRRPWLEAIPGDGTGPLCVGHTLTFLGGPLASGSLIACGVEGGDYRVGSSLGQALLAACDAVVRSPRILGVQPLTTPFGQGPARLGCRVILDNPLAASLPVRLAVRLGDGQLTAELETDLPPRQRSSPTLWLGEVPKTFPLTRFAWEVELDGGSHHDRLEDCADVGQALGEAAAHLVRLQRAQGDGRYSIYFFTDAYAARFLHALAASGEALPGMALPQRQFSDLLRPDVLRASAYRFCDLMVARQAESGGLPIGYGERDDLLFTADGGSIALGLLQIAADCPDPGRRERYIEAGRRYEQFRESLYITAERSQRLQAEFGPGARGTRAGLYGLGVINSDLVTKTGRWPEARLEERGLYWVMPISVGAVCALHRLLPGDGRYAAVARRDAAEYLEQDYAVGRVSYFHVEGLFWLLSVLPDAAIRSGLQRKIDASMPFLFGDGSTFTYAQGRGALHWLNLAYSRQQFGDSPGARVAMAQAVWSLASRTTELAFVNLAERFPDSGYGPGSGAYRCMTHGAIALLELLCPGATVPWDTQALPTPGTDPVRPAW